MKPIEDKNFIKFLGKPLIEHQIENIKKAGIKDITIIAGAHNLASLKKLDPKIRVIEQENLDHGMAGAMMSLEKHLKKNEEIIVLSANDYLDLEAFRLMKKAASKSQAVMLMLAKKVKSYFPGGYIKVDSHNRVQKIVEKPGEGKEPSDMINIVLHIHRNPLDFIRTLKKLKTKNDDWYELAIDEMIKEGSNIEAVPFGGFWQALKYPWHILELQKYFLARIKKSKIAKTVQVAKTAVIKGSVVIGEGVRIFDHATVVGPVYIGANTVIANNSLVRESEIGDDCVIGFNSEVARSNLSDKVWLHTNYIGDSVLCDNVALGAGSVTGNLRLDEGEIKVTIQDKKIVSGTTKLGAVIGANSRIGINVSLMPGVKIGSGSFIGGGLAISQDIPNNSFARGETKLKITSNTTKVTDRKNQL
jgi:bifunctional UDP-N-acetylglucosamine pyrophosphorylase/glucosamine-1-phosphate N-acetyltransferase